jgi:hypothetical protein
MDRAFLEEMHPESLGEFAASNRRVGGSGCGCRPCRNAGREYEWEAPEPYQWPTGRSFFPSSQSVPTGPYQTTTSLPCQRLRTDAAGLRATFNALNRNIERLAGLRTRSAGPDAWDEAIFNVDKLRGSTAAAMRGMIARLKSGFYRETDKCTRGPRGQFAQVTSDVRKLVLHGGWRRIPIRRDSKGEFIENLHRLRDVLVFHLRQSR